MYSLLAIDAFLRIAAALVFLFVLIPALALSRPDPMRRMEWLWWNLGVGIVLLNWFGQIVSLLNAHAAPTLLLTLLIVVVVARARRQGVRTRSYLRRHYLAFVLLSLNLLEGRVHVARRIRRIMRRGRARFVRSIGQADLRTVTALSSVVAVSAVFRFYRPFVTANLGFSDTYVHLYLMRLLEGGVQLDPAWGPYPRGMHFLLLAIEHLTNIDTILLMNFFGPFVGVLMTLAVADTARRLSGDPFAGAVAGLMHATTIGGPDQWFILGGIFRGPSLAPLATLMRPGPAWGGAAGDLVLNAFLRQTVTLPQELAIVLLFPAALFLLKWFRMRDGWNLAGFGGCVAAIASVHSGVVVPLLLVCAVVTVAAASEWQLDWRGLFRSAGTGGLAVLAGSTWTLGFLYQLLRGSGTGAGGGAVSATALYYFPFLRNLSERNAEFNLSIEPSELVAMTPSLWLCLALAAALLLVAIGSHTPRRGNLVFTSLAMLCFFYTHMASTLGWPTFVDIGRNAEWLMMIMTILIGVASAELVRLFRKIPIPLWPRLAPLAQAAILVMWFLRVPSLEAKPIRKDLIDYSGYGGMAYAVIRIERELEPFTWTLVTYGQEYPMVLGRGFHLPAAQFLDRYDPAAPVLAIPTPDIFIGVEKTAHRFQINAWSARFSREDLERRLQTWCYVYQLNHTDMRLFLEDEDIRIYVIHHSDELTRRIAEELRR